MGAFTRLLVSRVRGALAALTVVFCLPVVLSSQSAQMSCPLGPPCSLECSSTLVRCSLRASVQAREVASSWERSHDCTPGSKAALSLSTLRWRCWLLVLFERAPAVLCAPCAATYALTYKRAKWLPIGSVRTAARQAQGLRSVPLRSGYVELAGCPLPSGLRPPCSLECTCTRLQLPTR